MGLHAAGLLGWGWLLGFLGADRLALRLSLALLTALAVWVFIYQRLNRNHPPSRPERLWPGLGWASTLTWTRAGLLTCLAALIPPLDPEGPLYWFPIALWSGAVALDGLDGIAARRQGRVSRLGAELDIEADGMGVAIAAMVGALSLNLPLWFVPVCFLRPLFAWGEWLRRRRERPLADWPQSDTRRQVAGLQFAGLGMALWPGVATELVLICAAVLSTLLILGFARDWACVVGVPAALNLQERLHRGRPRAVRRVWLPVSLRALACLGLLTSVAERVAAPPPWEAPAISVLGLGTACLLLLGRWVRTSALLLWLLIGLLSTVLPFVPSMGMAAAAGMGLFLIGKGENVIEYMRTLTGRR